MFDLSLILADFLVSVLIFILLKIVLTEFGYVFQFKFPIRKITEKEKIFKLNEIISNVSLKKKLMENKGRR